MDECEEIQDGLRRAPIRSLSARLVRCVALRPLIAGGTVDFLFTSAKPNRYNPAGVHCVYFAEDEQTARAEYARRLGTASQQPVATYFAEVKLSRILDLNDSKTRAALGLELGDLSGRWVGRKSLVRTQWIGFALSQ